MAAITTSSAGHDVRVPATKILINNRWVDSVSGKTFPVINPSTGEEVCQVAEAR
jgi:aldehyde dehydrogenase (NAD+)